MRVMTIANTKIQVLEHNGERVMTTAQVNKVFDNKKLVTNYRASIEKRLQKPFYLLKGDEVTAYVNANECPLPTGNKGMKLWRQDAVRLFASHSKNENADAIMQELNEKYFAEVIHQIDQPKPSEAKAIAPIKPERSIEQTIIFNDGKVDGRSLYEFLQVETPYHIWFPRMCEYGFIEGTDFCTKMYESTGGRPAINHDMTMDMAKEIAMIQRNERGKQARLYFIECEKRLKQKPMTQLDILVESAKALQEHEKRMTHIELDMAQVKEAQRIQNARLDTMNGACIEGDKRQKLNAMVRLYAQSNGLQYSKGWGDFVQAYNTAYRTNLKTKKDNYAKKHELKKINVPEYLEAVGMLDDALLIADKMLNPTKAKG